MSVLASSSSGTARGRAATPCLAPAVSVVDAKVSRAPRAGLVATIRAHPLAVYFGLAIALSWAYWLPDAFTGGNWSHFPGLLGPAIAAVVVSACCGRDSRRELSRRTTRWRVPLKWYVVACAPMLVAGVSLAVRAATGTTPDGGWSHMRGLPDAGWIGVAALVLVINGFGEEIGWRGFAWPKLRERRTLAHAAVLLAVPWVVWHLPLFWVKSGFSDMSIAMVPGLFFSLACGAVVMGWLVERTESVVIVALFHTMLNMATATSTTTPVAAFVSATVIIWAVWLVRSDHTEASLASPPQDAV
jgi:membrane protease YdiL (CAAX protease family)